MRDLARKRLQLVRTRNAQIVSVQSTLARQTGGRLTSNAVKRMTVADTPALGLAEEVTAALAANVALIQTLNAQIARLEARLRARMRLRPGYRVLISVPGIGEVLATLIMLETGAIERFAAVGNFASYARCVDSAHRSNNKKKGAGNVKNGNKYLAWAFIEAANLARRYCPQAQRFYERKKAATHGILATKALAHKLARACYPMLKQGQPFDVTRCFA